MTSLTRVSLFLLYGITGIAAIVIAGHVRVLAGSASSGTTVWWQALLLVSGCAAVLLLVLRRIRARLFWEVLFGAALFFGAWILGFSLMTVGPALAFAAGCTLLPILFPRVVFHNAFVAVGALGAALRFAPMLSPEGMVVLLVGLVLYDMLVTGPEGPLSVLVGRLAKKAVLPGWIIPRDLAGWWASLSTPLDQHAAFLGAGDIVVPLTLVMRVGFFHAWAAVVVLAGALAGLLFLSTQHDRHPRAGLPWLAVGAALPFLVFRYLGYFV